jgi:hypothetical protein
MSITRLDKSVRKSHRSTGWWVRVSRMGVVHSKLFSDLKCGGSKQAQEAAIEYEQSLLAKLPKQFASAGTMEQMNKTNTYRVGKIYVREDAIKTYWYNEDGSEGRASFSIFCYGSLALTYAILSFRSKKRIEKATRVQHRDIQLEYANKFPNFEEMRNLFVKV